MIWTTWLLGVALQFEGQRLSASASTCESRDQCLTESSALYKALVGFTYRTLEKLKPLECHQACNADFLCQSFNYVMLKETCEPNNRTKDARPGHSLPDKDRFYVKRITNRGTYTLFNKLPSVFPASVLLLIMNFFITLSKWINTRIYVQRSNGFSVHVKTVFLSTFRTNKAKNGSKIVLLWILAITNGSKKNKNVRVTPNLNISIDFKPAMVGQWLLQAGLYFPPHRYAFLFFLSVKLGSVRELAAFSCHETAESDSENIASGNYWLKPINSMAPPSLVYRAMTPEGEISKLWLSCIVPRNLAKRGLFFCDKKNGT